MKGLKPRNALELAGMDLYIRESCNVCHSQMIRPFRAETERYGHYSVAGEFVIASLVVSAVLWILSGLASGWLHQRLSRSGA